MLTENEIKLFYNKIKIYFTNCGYSDKISDIVISNLIILKHDADIIVAEYKDTFYHNTIIKKHLTEIQHLAKEIWGENINFLLRSNPEIIEKKVRKKIILNNQISLFENTNTQIITENKTKKNNKNNTFDEKTTISEKSNDFSDILTDLTTNEKQSEKNISNSDFSMIPSHSLILDMTFNNFVRGISNQMALVTCENICKQPGILANPVFIYGSTGLGKTHLLHAVGNELFQKNSKRHILYVTSEDFVNDFTSSIRQGKINDFHLKYRSVDILLVDDIQFLEGKEGTQLAFFHIFNDLYTKKTQILLTSDRIPNDIPTLSDRLRSRFQQGIIVDIEPPAYEDRLLIVREKSQKIGLNISNNIIDYIANNIKTNVREIQGVLTNLFMHQNMYGQSPSLNIVQNLLKHALKNQGNTIDITTVQKTVSSYYNIKITELISTKRVQKLVIPRHIAMYLSREKVGSNLIDIAEAFQRKDHTTVIHAVEKIKELLENDASTRAAVNEISRQLEKLMQ